MSRYKVSKASKHSKWCFFFIRVSYTSLALILRANLLQCTGTVSFEDILRAKKASKFLDIKAISNTVGTLLSIDLDYIEKKNVLVS